MSQGGLTINSVNLNLTGSTRAWWIRDLAPLWGAPAIRGEDVLIPGTSGKRFYARTVDETTYRLPMVIAHTFDRTGTPYADPSNGLQTNIAYLRSNVITPSYAALVTATLTLPSGSTKTASVTCQLDVSDHYGNSATSAVLYVTVPAGQFA